MFFNNQPRRKLIPQGQPTKQNLHGSSAPQAYINMNK